MPVQTNGPLDRRIHGLYSVNTPTIALSLMLAVSGLAARWPSVVPCRERRGHDRGQERRVRELFGQGVRDGDAKPVAGAKVTVQRLHHARPCNGWKRVLRETSHQTDAARGVISSPSLPRTWPRHGSRS